MTQNEFLGLCLENCVAPEIVLENENIRQALKERNDGKIKEIIKNEF